MSLWIITLLYLRPLRNNFASVSCGFFWKTELRDAFVPWWHLTARKAKSKPWFTKELRRLTQKGLRCYRTFCDTPTDINKLRLKNVTLEVKTCTFKAKHDYTESLQSLLKDKQKEFWKHVKRNGKDNVSTPTLISGDDVFHDNIDKAECLNRYFSSVFTPLIAPGDGDPHLNTNW